MKKNSFKGLNIDCIQYSNIIRITYYLYSYSGTILNPNIIRIRPNICVRILFVFVFAHSQKTNIICNCIRSKFWFRIIFVFGPKNSIRSPLSFTFFGTYCIVYVFSTLPFHPLPLLITLTTSIVSDGSRSSTLVNFLKDSPGSSWTEPPHFNFWVPRWLPLIGAYQSASLLKWSVFIDRWFVPLFTFLLLGAPPPVALQCFRRRDCISGATQARQAQTHTLNDFDSNRGQCRLTKTMKNSGLCRVNIWEHWTLSRRFSQTSLSFSATGQREQILVSWLPSSATFRQTQPQERSCSRGRLLSWSGWRGCGTAGGQPCQLSKRNITKLLACPRAWRHWLHFWKSTLSTWTWMQKLGAGGSPSSLPISRAWRVRWFSFAPRLLQKKILSGANGALQSLVQAWTAEKSGGGGKWCQQGEAGDCLEVCKPVGAPLVRGQGGNSTWARDLPSILPTVSKFRSTRLSQVATGTPPSQVTNWPQAKLILC